MFLVEILQNVIVGILIGYLALTNSIAQFILSTFQDSEIVTIPAPEDIREQPNAQLVFTELPSQYEYGGNIPRILIENAGFQQASIGASIGLDNSWIKLEELSLRERVEDSLVNIFCQFTTNNMRRTTTGTGYFISSNGVVLTNAHVAQFLLLENAEDVEDAECILRAGNPAEPLYTAKLLYLPPTWVNDYAAQITKETPGGTGERDYALLYVSDTIGNAALPARFTYLQTDTSNLSRSAEDTAVLLAGYPAEILKTEGASAELQLKIASSTIGEIYTFGSNYADIFSLSSSSVGQRGASGGPVITPKGSAIGLITTKGDNEIDGPQSLRAITLSYINRTITEETGFSLEQNMSGDLAFRGNVYRNALVPILSKILTIQLIEN